jgi:DNA-binding transcriptional MerR regulator
MQPGLAFDGLAFDGLTFESGRGFTVECMDKMKISALAERSGVPVTTLRFYEQAGLVPAERSDAGYRLYGPDAVERLGFIGVAKHLGLPLEEIAELLDIWERGACAQVRADLRPRLAARLDQAEARRVEVETFIGELQRALAHLDALPDRSERCDPRCGFLTRSSATGTGSATDTAADLPWTPERSANRQYSEPESARRQGAPVACSLQPGELQERAAQWRDVLTGGRRRRIDQGVAVTVPSARAGQIAALCVAEQECFPFFDFVLRLDGPVAHLEVRAPEGARELVEQLTA